ncbi:MAG: hypothetical protein ACI9IP_002785 [Arcticibacterium sp.]|jgi:hypothetical protein
MILRGYFPKLNESYLDFQVQLSNMESLVIFEKTSASLFIILILILLAFWCLPEGYFFRDILHKKFSKLICWAGLDNYWALFAPQPVSKNFLIGFELEFKNGTIQSWTLPEYIIKNGYQFAPHFRFIKMHNQLLSQNDDIPKIGICDFILREYVELQGSEDVPDRIHILRFYKPANTSLITEWLSDRIFTYQPIK